MCSRPTYIVKITLNVRLLRTAGKIALSSALLQFWDLGGQRGIRSIWPKYYGDCHAVVYVIDAVDHERLSEGWEVFGNASLSRLFVYAIRLTGTHVQTRSYRRHRSSASHCSCSRTSRIVPTRSPSRRSGITTRSGTSIRSRARGGGRGASWIMSSGGSVLPVWTLWAYLRWKGEIDALSCGRSYDG
jgi:hypothetical protein